MITLEMAAVGYEPGKPVLSRINLRLDPDDRVALLGRNGNGKTTLARLIAGQLPAMAGEINASGKLRVGYFTQYQVEELDGDDTPLQHMGRLMAGATPAAVRAQLGRFGFSGVKATMRVARMSGGERARLALALVTRDAPHLLILDEPTNHLDVDSREALVQALNGYGGAVVVVSHDRHMLELTADRLILVDGGTVKEFDGSLDDYTDLILGKTDAEGAPEAPKSRRKDQRRAAAEARGRRRSLISAISAAEVDIARLEARKKELEQAMLDPSSAGPADGNRKMGELLRQHAEIAASLSAAEARWLEASDAAEQSGAGLPVS